MSNLLFFSLFSPSHLLVSGISWVSSLICLHSAKTLTGFVENRLRPSSLHVCIIAMLISDVYETSENITGASTNPDLPYNPSHKEN